MWGCPYGGGGRFLLRDVERLGNTANAADPSEMLGGHGDLNVRLKIAAG